MTSCRNIRETCPVLFLLGLLCVCTPAFAETIELVTYYPASSNAGDLHVRSLTVGTAYQGETPGDGVALIANRLGIGTNAPAVLLDLQDPGDAAFVRVQGSGDADNFAGLELRSDEATDKVWQIVHKRAGGLNDLHVNYFNGAGWSTKMAFQPNGNIGIGTTNPAARLHVVSTGTGQPRGVISSQHNDGTHASIFIGRKSRGTLESPTVVNAGDFLVGLVPEGYDGSAYVQSGWAGFVVNGAVGAGSVPSDFAVNTGASGQGSERLRVTSSGNVGIGTTTPLSSIGNGSLTRSLDVNGWILARGNGGNTWGDPATRIGVAPGGDTSDTWWISANQNHTFAISQNNVGDRLIMDTGGAVGIGALGAGDLWAFARIHGSRMPSGRPNDWRTLLLSNDRPENTNGRFIDCIRYPASDSEFIVYNNGAFAADGGYIGRADYAEWLETEDADLSPGELVSLDLDHPNHIRRAAKPGDPLLFGVISTNPGVIGTRADDVTDAAERREKDPRWKKVAFLGQVPVKVTGGIAIGDPITSSSTSGVGTKAMPGNPIVAIALEPHAGAKPGLINCAAVPNGGRFQTGVLEMLREQQAQIQELKGEVASLKRAATSSGR